MKKITLAILGALTVGASVYAVDITQTLSQRQVRDPRQLAVILEDNFEALDDRTDGTTPMAELEVTGVATFNHSIVAISTNDTSTNTIVTVDAEVDPAYIEDAALDVAAITCDSVASAGDISGTTLNASGDAEFAADVHVASGAATQQWDNGSALIDTGALEDGPIDVAAVTCDSVAASGIITAANLTTTTDTIAGDLNITSNLVVSGTSTTLVFGAGSDIDMITDAGTATNTIASNGVLAGGHMSGDIAVARISDALTAPGTIGSVTPAAGAFTTLASSGEASMAGGQAILKDGSLASAQTATNNAPILLAGTIVQLDATGSVTAYTNTVTLTSLGTGTNGVFYVINTGTSNLLAIAQTGTWKSPAVELGTNEAMTVIGIAGAFYGIE